MEILESSQFEAILGIGPPTVSRLKKRPRSRIRLLVCGFGEVVWGSKMVGEKSNVSWLKGVRSSASATMIFWYQLYQLYSVISTIHSHGKRGLQYSIKYV